MIPIKICNFLQFLFTWTNEPQILIQIVWKLKVHNFLTTFWIIFLKKVFEKHFDNKSVNLQYNMLVRWDKRLNNQASDVPIIIFFIICYRLGALKTLYFYYKKINWNNFSKRSCKKLWKKNNTWNIRRLVDESFVPAFQRTSVLYWRLTDLMFWKTFGCFGLWTHTNLHNFQSCFLHVMI